MKIENPKVTALIRALNTLKTLDAKFKIVMPDGAEFGELKIVREAAPVAAPAPVQQFRFPAPKRAKYKHLFENKLAHMKVGDVAVIDVPAGVSGGHLRGSVSSHCCDLWGNGAYQTTLRGDKVHVLRKHSIDSIMRSMNEAPETGLTFA